MNWYQKYLMDVLDWSEEEVTDPNPIKWEDVHMFVQRTGHPKDVAWKIWNEKVLENGKYGYITRAQFIKSSSHPASDF